MKQSSLGFDSTLKNHRDMAAAVFGEESPAVKFPDEKIVAEGENSEVIADEGQFIALLSSIHFGTEPDEEE